MLGKESRKDAKTQKEEKKRRKKGKRREQAAGLFENFCQMMKGPIDIVGSDIAVGDHSDE